MINLKGGGELPPKPNLTQLFKGFMGGLISISALGYIGQIFDVYLLMAPFGATCVILFAVPNSPLAQPRNVILGHLISSIIGIAGLYLLGDSIIIMGLSVGLAIMLMLFFRAVHPPAGANPILIILAGKSLIGLNFILTPVLLGCIILVLISLIINNLGKNYSWPVYWHGINFDKNKFDN